MATPLAIRICCANPMLPLLLCLSHSLTHTHTQGVGTGCWGSSHLLSPVPVASGWEGNTYSGLCLGLVRLIYELVALLLARTIVQPASAAATVYPHGRVHKGGASWQRNATPENIVAAHGGGACAAEAAAAPVAPGEEAAPTTANETFFIATLFFWGFSICRKSVGKQEENGRESGQVKRSFCKSHEFETFSFINSQGDYPKWAHPHTHRQPARHTHTHTQWTLWARHFHTNISMKSINGIAFEIASYAINRMRARFSLCA